MPPYYKLHIIERFIHDGFIVECSDALNAWTILNFDKSGGYWISLNGTTGEVYNDKIKTIDPELSGHFGQLMERHPGPRRKVTATSTTRCGTRIFKVW